MNKLRYGVSNAHAVRTIHTVLMERSMLMMGMMATIMPIRTDGEGRAHDGDGDDHDGAIIRTDGEGHAHDGDGEDRDGAMNL